MENSPLASSMFAPGVQYVMRDFHTTDQMLGSFVVSVYILGYMLGPFLIAPLSEIYGRVPLYHACNVIFLVFTIACAVAQTLPQLIVFRLFAGIAGVCPITIGSGTVADMVPVEKRAGIMAIWALGPILGPVVGPIAGGFLAESVGWRWVFWVLAIAVAVTYGYLYLMFTTLTPIFRNTYGFSSGLAGLAYLGFGIGSILGLKICGVVSNRIAVSHTARGCFKPESRLPPMLFGSWAIPAGLFWYGWSAQAHTHWIVPILGTGVFAIGLMVVFMASNTYLVDSYLRHAASVTAAATVLRSLIGAVLPLAGPSMYDALGLGWGNSLLAFIALAMCACPLLFWKYGEFIRTHPRFQIAL
ncbi:unnamed protein product [Aspergillus oryzae]|uniref:Unnamed protein product n=1 Tax=Aspergillus oryzae TaxID=5062 RepID=A0AAN4YKZ0_ASPOZ|nr:unnamed protein product [Aspergillus oryzae]